MSSGGSGSLGKHEGAVRPQRIAVHCVAGLGRAPCFVAAAMVHAGCSPINAIKLIRDKRPGSMNNTQANFILEQKRGKVARNGSKENAGCECVVF